jgi:hypothetical protein
VAKLIIQQVYKYLIFFFYSLKKKLFKMILATLYISSATTLNVAFITDFSGLGPRSTPPRDVTGLRVDDIKIITSLGDW